MADYSFLSRPLQLPEIDVLAPYKQALSLRQLADAREYQRAQMRHMQLQEQEAQREYDEQQDFQRNYKAGMDTSEIFRRWPSFGPKVLKSQSEALTQSRLAQTQEEQRKKEATANQRAINEQIANLGMEAAKIPLVENLPEGKVQPREEWFNQGVAATLIDHGITPSEQFGAFRVPGDEKEAQRFYSRINGPDKLNALLKAEREKTSAALKTTGDQLELFGHMLGSVRDQDSYTAALSQAPLEIRSLLNPRFSPDELKRANGMVLTAQQRATEEGQAATRQATLDQHKATQEGSMRDDFRQESKNYLVMRDGFQRVRASAASNSGPGDLSMLYGFMKLLDPNSVVRETEFQMASSAGSIPERMRGAWLRVINGQRLDPDVKAEFLKEAESINRQNQADHTKMSGTYRRIAERGGLNPENVVVDYNAAEPEAASPQQTTSGAPAEGGPVRNVPLQEVMPGYQPQAAPAKPKPKAPVVGQIIEGEDGWYRYDGGALSDRKSYKKVRSK